MRKASDAKSGAWLDRIEHSSHSPIVSWAICPPRLVGDVTFVEFQATIDLWNREAWHRTAQW